MKAIMYHYVRENVNLPPYGYYHLNIDDFRAQLDHFESTIGFVNKSEFIECIHNGTEPPEGVVLTFDDGLIDHYRWVLPELQSRDLWAIFYVPTTPMRTETVLDVHRVHSLIGKVDHQKLLAAIDEIVREKMIQKQNREEFKNNTYQKQDSAEGVSYIKQILNYYTKDSYRTQIIDRLETKFFEESISVEDLYLSEEQIQALDDAGMIVGAHSVTHRVLSQLSEQQQREEISQSFGHLDEIVDTLPYRTFCYPYGGSHTYTSETKTILDTVNCSWTFDVRSQDIDKEELESPQTLPRYDCCEFPHGTASARL
jgi:peptidoglycan/xylan/chitin deacetylase (PgdA/CDA1 family)